VESLLASARTGESDLGRPSAREGAAERHLVGVLEVAADGQAAREAGHADAVAKAVDSIQSHSTSHPVSFAQRGALAALKGDQQPLADMREEFDMRRNYMYDRVTKIPNITAVRPQGAFYILVNISQLGLSSQNFADRLLSKANVAVIPGAAFGDDRTVRLSYATSLDVIKKGMDRFQDFCRTL